MLCISTLFDSPSPLNDADWSGLRSFRSASCRSCSRWSCSFNCVRDGVEDVFRFGGLHWTRAKNQNQAKNVQKFEYFNNEQLNCWIESFIFFWLGIPSGLPSKTCKEQLFFCFTFFFVTRRADTWIYERRQDEAEPSRDENDKNKFSSYYNGPIHRRETQHIFKSLFPIETDDDRENVCREFSSVVQVFHDYEHDFGIRNEMTKILTLSVATWWLWDTPPHCWPTKPRHLRPSDSDPSLISSWDLHRFLHLFWSVSFHLTLGYA